MTLRSQLLRSNRTRVVMGVVAIWLGFQLWLAIIAPGKISPELAGASEKVNIQVDLPFTPERFHVLALQKYGRVAGAGEHSIDLRSVRRVDLTSIARRYWVKGIETLKEEQ
jgi:hypothetical protein